MNLLFVGPLQSDADNGSKNLLKSRKSLILTRTSEAGWRTHEAMRDRFSFSMYNFELLVFLWLQLIFRSTFETQDCGLSLR